MFFFRSRFSVVQKIFFDGEKKERAGKTNGRKTKKKAREKKSAAFEFQTDWCHWRLIRVFLKKKSSRRTRFTKRTFGLWTEFFRERCFRSVYNCWVFVQNNNTASLLWASLKEISTDNLFWREINRNQSIQHFLFRAKYFRVWTKSCFLQKCVLFMFLSLSKILSNAGLATRLLIQWFRHYSLNHLPNFRQSATAQDDLLILKSSLNQWLGFYLQKNC